jgi:hypothetical protein
VRALQIYRAFLATSTLMLVVSAVLDHYGIDAPNLALDDVSVTLASPLTGLAELLTFQRQPYLASVLPIYMLFAGLRVLQAVLRPAVARGRTQARSRWCSIRCCIRYRAASGCCMSAWDSRPTHARWH